MDKPLSQKQTGGRYFQTSLLKFCLMSVCTLGIYEIYWSYKNWHYVKSRDKSNISLVWRSFFYPLWYYAFLNDIAKETGSRSLGFGVVRILLAGSLLILIALARLPDPYWLVTFLTFVPFLPAVMVIERVNAGEVIREPARSHSPWNCAAYLLGGTLVVFTTLASIGFLPSGTVVEGNRLWDRDIEFLELEGMLGENEQILYFYSAGVFSIREDGQFISEEYVTSYGRDPTDGELYGGVVRYEDIEDIKVSWSHSFLEDTWVTIVASDGDELDLLLSPESGGDRTFINEMMQRWKRAERNNLEESKQGSHSSEQSSGL